MLPSHTPLHYKDFADYHLQYHPDDPSNIHSNRNSGHYVDSHGVPHEFQLHFIDSQGIVRDYHGHAIDVEGHYKDDHHDKHHGDKDKHKDKHSGDKDKHDKDKHGDKHDRDKHDKDRHGDKHGDKHDKDKHGHDKDKHGDKDKRGDKDKSKSGGEKSKSDKDKSKDKGRYADKCVVDKGRKVSPPKFIDINPVHGGMENKLVSFKSCEYAWNFCRVYEKFLWLFID